MIALIDYGMGNLSSVYKAFVSIGAEGIEIVATPEEVQKADAIILPGVGNFGDGIKNLKKSGMDKVIVDSILSGKPYLGICLGMQLLFESSDEADNIPGLGVLKGQVTRFSGSMALKIPHIGWNSVNFAKEHPYVLDIKSGEFFYFVHSFYVVPEDKDIILGKTDYGIDFCSCIANDNIFAVQFHPEKSQNAGLRILKNFVDKTG